MKKYSHRLIFCLLVWGSSYAQTPPSGSDTNQPLPPDALIRVGKTIIKTDQFKTYLSSLDKPSRESLKNSQVAQKVLSDFITLQMILNVATEKKWDQEASVQAQMEIARQKALAQSYLDVVAKPGSDYPSDSEIVDTYKKLQDKLKVSATYSLAQIVVAQAREGDPTPENKTKLAHIQADLKAGKDFSELAKSSSDDKNTAVQGGKIGTVLESQIEPDILNKISGLAKGQVSEPIRLKDGWHFFKVVDHISTHMATLEEARSQIRDRLISDKTEANRQAFISKIAGSTSISINQNDLAQLLESASK